MHRVGGGLGRFLPNGFSQPVGCRSLEKFGDGNALAADEEFGGGVVCFVGSCVAGESLPAAAAFYLDGDQGVTSLEHEIDFQVSLAPIGDLDAGADCGVDEVRADCGFDQAAPAIAVAAPGLGAAAGLDGHEGRVEDLQFGGGGSLADLRSGILRATRRPCPRLGGVGGNARE